ncbi:MAG: phosphomannomutase, partial [Pseudomonadota bacterium]
SDCRKNEIISQIKQDLYNNNINFDNTDGIRVDYGDAWWLIRISNTEDALVIRCEAKSQTRLMQVKHEIQQYLARRELICHF